MKTIDMTKGEPFKLIISYSVPMLIGQLFQQLYSLCDTVIVGKLLGKNALAAVGNTGAMNFLVLGFLYGMTSGFAVITAQKFGAHDKEGLSRSVAMNIILNLASGIIITVISCVLTKPILLLTNTPQEIFSYSFDYIFVIFLGILATVLYNGCACVLRAVGDSKTPLYFLIISSFLNIALDYVFIKYCGLGVKGAALATVISQGVSGFACIIWIGAKFPVLKVSAKDFKWDRRFAMKHLSIGMNMGFQFSITAVGVVILQGALNRFGSTKIAAYTAAQKVEQLVTLAAGVIGVTIANYAGQNFGAGKLKRVKEGVSKAIIISVSFAVLAAVLAWAFGEQMVSIFIDKNGSEMTSEIWKDLIDSSQIYLHLCSVFFPILFVLFIYRNALQGIGLGFWPLMGGVFELIARTAGAFAVSSAYTSGYLTEVTGFAGICASGPFAWIAATVPLGIAYYIIMSKLSKNTTFLQEA